MCDCEGEGWSRRPLRTIRSGDIADDIGERVLSFCEDASGVRPVSCAWFALRDPFVAETIRAHAWRELGQLEVKYPRGVPSRIVWGVEAFGAALNAVRVHDIREDRAAAERDRAEKSNRP